MLEDALFRRTFKWVAAVHLLGVTIFVLLAKWHAKVPTATPVTWLDGGTLGGALTQSETAEVTPAPSNEPEVAPVEVPAEEPESNPVPAPETPQPSEIVLPKSTPVPATPRPTTPKPATPKPATPKPATPKPATPKSPTPKVPPKTTPKPTPKASSPQSTPVSASKSKPPAVATGAGKAADPATQKKTAAAGDTKEMTNTTSAKASGTGNSTGTRKGPGRSDGGSSARDEFAWYYQMLQDRFESRWQQPTSVVRSSQDFITTIKLRINKDGTVIGREIVNPSGNTVMDESVLAAAEKVQNVDPLPAGLGGETLEVNINFKLDQGQ